MTNPNQHIDEFLDYYCGLASPQYAVMLKGKWGSGKTHYINEYKKRLDIQKKKYIYVSLYGVTSYDEIETKFLEVLHPVLTHKKTILASKIAKGLLKATIKVDLDGDAKADGSVSGQIPSENIGDLFNTKGYILIFDDLERCSIDINDLLGYVNYFVEHENYRVILLANDEKFKNKDEYKDIKEKLIGKEFELVSNVELAYDSFIKEIDSDIFNVYKKDILKIYKQSTYNNLRVLRQIIFDFDRFYKIIGLDKFKDESVYDLLKVYFILSFENKFSEYDIFKLEKYYSEYFSLAYSQKSGDEEKSKEMLYYKLINKYSFYLKGNILIDIEDWKEILSNSFIEKEKISNSLKNTRYYQFENSPNWKKLWHYKDYNEQEYTLVLKAVENELIDKKLESIDVVRHVSAILISLIEYDLYDKTKAEVVSYSKNHIDYLYEQDKIHISLFENLDYVLSGEPFGNLGYFSEDNEYSKEFLLYLGQVLEKGKKALFKNDAEKIPLLLKENSNEAKELIEKKYSHFPIFSLVDINRLIKSILSFNRYSFLDIGYIFKERYTSISYNKELKVELDFLLELKKEFENINSNELDKIVKHNLDLFIKYSLSKAIDDIEKYNNKENKNNEIQ